MHQCIFLWSVCHQTNFEEHVIPVKRLRSSTHQVLLHDCLTGYKSVDSVEYICLTCKKSIYRGQVPKLSIKNKCGFPIQPPELILFPLEERLISPIIPFMNVRECPVGGQKAIHGSICHVPVDVAPTVNSLPCHLEENDTISVKINVKNPINIMCLRRISDQTKYSRVCIIYLNIVKCFKRKTYK